jgi:hypothetical protein
MRIFMTSGFARTACRARIGDAELRAAAQVVAAGTAIALGGGVFKVRLNKHRHRGIVLARGGRNAFYVFLFAKQDQGDITQAELESFRRLAKGYESITAQQIADLLNARKLQEITRDAP